MIRKKNGFTLIELLISCVVLTLFLGAAMPSFSEFHHRLKMQRLATEMENVIRMARSEAVLRNKNMYLHLVGLDSSGVHSDWCILVSDKPIVSNCEDDVLYLVQSEDHRGVTVVQQQANDVIEFDRVNGHPQLDMMDEDGYQTVLSFYQKLEDKMVGKIHFLGRSKVCELSHC